MKNKIYELENSQCVNRDDLIVYEYKNFDKLYDVVYAEINGRHPKTDYILNTKSDETYMIISGDGEISLNGEVFKIKKNDVIPIKHGTKYYCVGNNLKLYCVITPPWIKEEELIIK